MLGRPTDYRPEYAEQAEKLTLLGATDIQLADFFEVAESTIHLWKHAHPKFSESIKLGKEIADQNVERSLYRKATGYEFESEKIFCQEGQIVRAQTREFVPPSDTAMIFWLKNRKPSEWRDRMEHTGKDGEPLQFVVKSILEKE
jgi:hypothetical protein